MMDHVRAVARSTFSLRVLPNKFDEFRSNGKSGVV
jgi:hypothetical protein